MIQLLLINAAAGGMGDQDNGKWFRDFIENNLNRRHAKALPDKEWGFCWCMAYERSHGFLKLVQPLMARTSRLQMEIDLAAPKNCLEAQAELN